MEHAPEDAFVDADRPAGVEDAEDTPARFFALFLFEFSAVGHLFSLDIFSLDIFHLIFGLLKPHSHSLPCPSLPSLE
jgi:hypothetical protein